MSRATKNQTELPDDLPSVIGVRTSDYAPVLRKWRQQNKHVPWSVLLKKALGTELAPLAGKRYAHLFENN